jgi:VIT1/CCC1 family predicted Fe2+/Mn2+ transporter
MAQTTFPTSGWAARLLLGEVPTSESEHALVLRVVQPALAGLMDGSVSTLAPLFATAFATQTSHTTFVVGLAAAVGAGISMAFSEGLSDSGELTGRGHPFRRGTITGVATFVGGVLHTLPFLIPNYHVSLAIAMLIVAIELLVIAWIRHHFFETPIGRSVVQVVVGGLLVFAAGVLLGSEG